MDGVGPPSSPTAVASQQFTGSLDGAPSVSPCRTPEEVSWSLLLVTRTSQWWSSRGLAAASKRPLKARGRLLA